MHPCICRLILAYFAKLYVLPCYVYQSYRSGAVSRSKIACMMVFCKSCALVRTCTHNQLPCQVVPAKLPCTDHLFAAPILGSSCRETSGDGAAQEASCLQQLHQQTNLPHDEHVSGDCADLSSLQPQQTCTWCGCCLFVHGHLHVLLDPE